MIRISLRPSHQTILRTAFVLLVVATTISFASTTFLSRALIEPARQLSALGTVGLVLMVLVTQARISSSFLFTAMIVFIMLIYGMMLAMLNGGFVHVLDLLLLNIGILFLGFYSFVNTKGALLNKVVARALVIYVCLLLGLTIALGGFTLSFPPRFVYEYATSIQTIYYEQTYSQGISKFYGLGAISTAMLATWVQTKGWRMMLFFMCMFFLLLSLMGGGRGDSIAAVVVTGLHLALHARRAFWLFGSVIFVVWLFLSAEIALEEFAFYYRFTQLLDGGLGRRDVLLVQSADLLAEQPLCLITGCGFGYFQAYHRVESGLHPHNLIVEMVIVYGIPLTMAILGTALRGIWLSLSAYRKNQDGIILIFLFFLLIGLKSGTLLNSWMFLICLFYFIYVAINGGVRELQLKTVNQIS
ncbi:MAG: hypothetical protein AAGB15_00180 [Pseudomonadota bacterium]